LVHLVAETYPDLDRLWLYEEGWGSFEAVNDKAL
jgi:hypothetical protein